MFRGGEGALQVLPPLVDVIPEARLNLVSAEHTEVCTVLHKLRLHTPSAQGLPMGNWLGLGSAWVSDQVIRCDYIANNFPWSNFDPAASEKINSILFVNWRSQTARFMV